MAIDPIQPPVAPKIERERKDLKEVFAPYRALFTEPVPKDLRERLAPYRELFIEPVDPVETPEKPQIGAASAKWLLPVDGKKPHLEIRTDCKVFAHVRYGDYFKRLGKLIPQATDTILIAAWELMIEPELEGKTAQELLKDAFKNRNVRIRALGSSTRKINVKTAAKLNGFRVSTTDPFLMHVDDQHSADGGHHQKAIYLGGIEPRIFIGGMDLTLNRFDGSEDFWLDCQVEIVGNAAERGRATLEERWRSCDAWKTGKTARAEFTPIAATKGDGSTFVQFVRTYGIEGVQAKKTKRLYANPDGEQTYHALLEHAIGMAKRFIYIEDQYFTGSPKFNKGMARLEEVLAKAAQRGVIVVAVIARSEHVETYFAPWSRRRDVMNVLTKDLDDKARVRVLQFKEIHTPDLAPPGNDPFHRNYVHTKTWIFDDELAVVGSANCNRTGMANESELGVGIVSSKGFGEFANLPFARALRIALWERIMNAPTTSTKVAAKDLSEFAQGLAILVGKNSPLEPYNIGTIDDSASYGEPECP